MAEGRRRNWAIGVGLVLTIFGAVSYFFFFARFPATRDFPWVNLPLVLAGVALSAVGAWRAWEQPPRWRNRALGTAGLVLSGLLASAFIAYVFVLSSMIPEPTPTTVRMERASDFELMSLDGRTVRLADLRGRKVVLVFYRGFW